MILNIISFILSCSSLIKLINVIKQESNHPFSIIFVFSLFSLFLVVFPLFIDSLMNLLGLKEEWTLLIDLSQPEFPYLLDDITIFQIALFVFIFNSVLLFKLNSINNGHKINATNIHAIAKKNFNTTLIFLAFGYIGLFFYINLYGFNWDSKGFGNVTILKTKNLVDSITVVFIQTVIPLSSLTFLFSSLQKKYFFSFISIIPALLISIVSGERTHIVPHIIFILYLFIFDKTDKSLKKAITLMIFGLLFFYGLRFFRIGFDNPIDFIIHNMYPIYRDDSNSNLYYCFDNIDNIYANNKGILNFFFIETQTNFDITISLALERVHWEWGSLHPTLYGWLYMDMKWMGLLFALFLRAVFWIYRQLSLRSLSYQLFLFPIFTSFIVISLRGSVQFAWSHFIYSFILISITTTFLIKHEKRNYYYIKRRT